MYKRQVLTRARVVWASDAAFGAQVSAAIEAALRRPRPGVDIAADVRKMRSLMDRERRPHGFWDLKLSPGGQVDAEFAAQFRQLQAAAIGERLTLSTLEALHDDPVLAEAWRVQQRLAHLLAAAFEGRVDPEGEPGVFQLRLAEAAGAPDFDTLKTELTDLRARARKAFERAVPAGRDGESAAPRSIS